MGHGEFESAKALHALSSDFAPYPIARGAYERVQDMQFLLCELPDMADGMPDPNNSTVRLAPG